MSSGQGIAPLAFPEPFCEIANLTHRETQPGSSRQKFLSELKVATPHSLVLPRPTCRAVEMPKEPSDFLFFQKGLGLSGAPCKLHQSVELPGDNMVN